jgi:aryl-alcohol dehydrogenase-like predicted oxidoreductase
MVSPLGLGTVKLGRDQGVKYPSGFQIPDDDEARMLLRQAQQLGINLIDTAPAYGRSEERLGPLLRGQRKDWVIVSKVGEEFSNGQSRHDFSAAHTRLSVERSLKRLETDYVDLWMLHNPRMDAIQTDDIFALLEDLKSEGKIRAYGASLGPAIAGTEHGDEALKTRKLDALQIIYNLLEQDPGRRFFPLARERNVGMLVRVPHSSGMLEGKYTPETTFPKSDHRSHRPRSWLVEGLQKVDRLKFLYEERGMTLGQAALKWVLAEPTVTSAQPNIYDREQLEEFAAAPDLPDLTPDDLREIAALYARNFDLEPAAV